MVLEILSRCGQPSSGAMMRRMTSAHTTYVPYVSRTASEALVPARARILITSSVADAECLSACEVFQMMLQEGMANA